MTSEILHVNNGPNYVLSSRIRSATNPVTTTGSGPNFIYNVESGITFTGIGDIVDFDFYVSAYQAAKADSLDLPAVNYRATDGSTGSLGFVDGQFDSAGHDTASGIKPTESLTIDFDLAGGSHTTTTITDGSAAAVSSSFSQVEGASVTEEVSISKIKLAKLASGSNTVSVRVVYELSGTEYTDASVIVDLFDGSFISTSAFGGLIKEACDVIDTGDGYYQVCVACTKKPTATRRRLYVSPAWASSVTTVSDSTLQGTVTYKDVENVGYDNGLLYTTALLDQDGSNNAVQGTAIQQPLLLRDGIAANDGVNDNLRTAASVIDDFTLIADICANNYDSTFCIMSNHALSMFFRYDQPTDALVFTLALTNVSFPVASIPNFSTLVAAGTMFQAAASCENSNELKIYLNGVLKDTTPITLDKFGDYEYLDIGSRNNGATEVLDGKIGLATLSGLLTDQNILDIYNQWEANKP